MADLPGYLGRLPQGVTYRTLDYWARLGIIVPENAGEARGRRAAPRRWPDSELAVAALIARLRDAGLELRAAATAARGLTAGGRAVLADDVPLLGDRVRLVITAVPAAAAGGEQPGGWRPDWCIAPAGILREWMQVNGVSVPQMAETCGHAGWRQEFVSAIEEVLAAMPLTGWHATVLARSTGISTRFWLGLEHDYRAGLAAGLTEYASDHAEGKAAGNV